MVSSTTEVASTFPLLSWDGRGQKFAKIAAAAGGTRELVAAVTGAKIRVLALLAEQQNDAAATFEFKSASTAISGEMTAIGENREIQMQFNPAGWMETAAGEALNVTVAANALAGLLVYEEVAG